jgi:galactokinase
VIPTVENRILELRVPSLDQTVRYDLEQLPPRQSQSSTDNADFALAAIHEALADGWEFPHGAVCTSTTEIVMQAGCSSSTAFCVAWVMVLAKLAAGTLGEEVLSDPLKVAQLAHKAEVLHFGAPGGTMDHVTIALGGSSCLRIGPGMWEVKRLNPLLPEDGVWVLADSGEPKDTMGHLKRCKGDRLAILDELGGNWDATIEGRDLDQDKTALIEATLTNRDTEVEATNLWLTSGGTKAAGSEEDPLGKRLASLMLRHHEALRDGLGLSTPKLEAMREAAIAAGAWGYKLVGSGGGGCAVAWASRDKADMVSKAMVDAGANQTWTIEKPSEGAKIITS